MQPGNNLLESSLERLEVIMALEQAFDIEIPGEGAKEMRTVGDAIDYMGKRKKGGHLN